MKIVLDDHLRSEIENETNYNTIFTLKQIIDKNSYKSSVFWVLISCCLFLLFFPEGFLCCRFCLSKNTLYWLPFNLGIRIPRRLLLIEIVSVYTLVDAWPFVASFPKLWPPAVQIFLTVLIYSHDMNYCE